MRWRNAGLAAAVWALFAVSLAASPTGNDPKDGASAAPEAEPIVLRWKARQERDVYGYIVYRSSRREGPYRRASREIVRKTEDGSYVWTDALVQAGETYFYYLDAISKAGRKTRFSGVQQKTAERRRQPEGGEAGQPGEAEGAGGAASWSAESASVQAAGRPSSVEAGAIASASR